jgi:membrane protease YdiL (CAAX protease family)
VRLHAGALLDGSWERPGRNPVAGAIAGLLICGGVYSTLGGVAGGIMAAVDMLRDPSWLSTGRLVDILVEYYRRFQVPILVVTAAAQFAVFFALTVALVRRWHSSRPFGYLSYRPPTAVGLVLAGAGAVAIVPLAEVLDRWSYVVLPPLRELAAGEASLLAVRTPWQAVLVFGTVAVTPAVCEEALFRGWLMGTLRRKLALVPAIIVQAVLFALFHMSPLSIVALAFVGLYLGWLFERAGTLFAPMTAHCLYNATMIGLANFQPGWLAGTSGGFSLPVVGGSLAAFAAVLFLIEFDARSPGFRRRRVRRRQPLHARPAGRLGGARRRCRGARRPAGRNVAPDRRHRRGGGGRAGLPPCPGRGDREGLAGARLSRHRWQFLHRGTGEEAGRGNRRAVPRGRDPHAVRGRFRRLLRREERHRGHLRDQGLTLAAIAAGTVDPRTLNMDPGLLEALITPKARTIVPVHLTGSYRAQGHCEGESPVAEATHGRYVSLPVHPRLTEEAVEYLISNVREVAGVR